MSVSGSATAFDSASKVVDLKALQAEVDLGAPIAELDRDLVGLAPVDEAYYLHRPENEKDYGQEAIEILLQMMENQREDLVVILAGYRERIESFFVSNPGFRSRIAHHIDFPDYDAGELLAIAEVLAVQSEYRLSPAARDAMVAYIARRREQPNFANARSIRNALDRARLRQAMRLCASSGVTSREALQTIEAEDIRASRVFAT
jgi:hypothetical protein